MSADLKTKHAQALVIFDEIATLANTLDREFYFSDCVEDRDAEDVECQLRRLRAAICHIGLLADFGTGGDVRGGVAEWLLPPAYAWAIKETAVSGS